MLTGEEKPASLFGREREWAQLLQFVRSGRVGARMAVVYGRRRQGKTMLLQALTNSFSGFYWQAREQSSAQNLASFASALARYSGTAQPFQLQTWEQATTALLTALTAKPDGPAVAVLDEVGYLIDSVPSFPSELQAVLSPLGEARRSGEARLILCGSSFGQMRRLLDADSPLRGRADLELVIAPFAYREAARFWGLESNPDAAFQLHSLVGGTAAYRDYSPVLPEAGDISTWAIRSLLDPGSPLFREGRVLVAEDPALGDQPLYRGVLGALSDGARSRGDLTEALGRPPTSLSHALTVLTDSGWIRAVADPLRQRATTFEIDEPIVRVHRLVIEPNEARITLRPELGPIWEESLPVVRSRIYGPHLERLAREWTLAWASTATLGGRATSVGPATIRAGRDKSVQLDVVAVATTPRGGRKLLAIGEVKASTTPVGVEQLDRLDRTATLIGGEAATCRRLIFARGGFTNELLALARTRQDVELIDLHRLYAGD
jgi:uncharacterized protein